MIIRDATDADMAGVMAIYNDAVAHTTAVWNNTQVDLANRQAWLAERRALLETRETDDILRAVDHMNLTAQWAQSRASGVPVRWRSVAGGFNFEGLAEGQLPTQWLSPSTSVRGDDALLLGPEPLIAAQGVTLVNRDEPQTALRVSTDGLRPFAVEAVQ